METKLTAIVDVDHDSQKGVYTVRISDALWPRMQEIIQRGAELVAGCDVEFDVRETPPANVEPSMEGPVT